MKLNLGGFSVDLQRLIDTRLLIQANSGGGKSWLLRKLIEECHGHAHVIVLDIEGEFSTLREKFDFILAGKNADVVADPKSAALLARKILELRTDLICDLYELKQPERIRFVRSFLEAMINAPKEVWHPTLLVLDEAHIFAPEKSQSESVGAVIDLATRGRKRGYCLVAATQRLSKLHKDVAAECGNKLIGRTGLDIDMRRAADELGFGKESMLSLRDLEPGQFFAFGPAISKSVIRVEIGKVRTTHPQSGAGRTKIHTPEPTEKVKAILAKLTDLPKKAEEELREKHELVTRVRELEREARAKPKPEIDPNALARSEASGYSRATREFNTIIGRYNRGLKIIRKALDEIDPSLIQIFGAAKPGSPVTLVTPLPKIELIKPLEPKRDVMRLSAPPMDEDGSIGKCGRAILGFLKMKEGQALSKIQIAAMTGYSPGSGSFNNSLSRLNVMGLIYRRGDLIQLNESANGQIDHLVGDEVPHRLEDWIGKLGKCERSIYQIVLDNPGTEFSKDEVAQQTGYSGGSGSFNNALSRLNTLGLIQRDGATIKLNPEVAGL